MDYLGDSQYVALYQDGATVQVADGVTVEDADPHGWWLFGKHTLVNRLLQGYDLGSDHHTARHWLVVDQLTGRLTIALPDDANTLLASQPHTREALTGDMNATDAAHYLDIAAEVAESRIDASMDTWLDYARNLRIAQRTMIQDLNLDLGGRLLAQIRGLATTIHDATGQPNLPRFDSGSRWTDLDQQASTEGPTAPDTPDFPSSEPDLG